MKKRDEVGLKLPKNREEKMGKKYYLVGHSSVGLAAVAYAATAADPQASAPPSDLIPSFSTHCFSYLKRVLLKKSMSSFIDKHTNTPSAILGPFEEIFTFF